MTPLGSPVVPLDAAIIATVSAGDAITGGVYVSIELSLRISLKLWNRGFSLCQFKID